MLSLIINSQSVDLEGVQFNLQLNSPIPFVPEDGMVEGSFAFGVSFPATPRNKKIFGFPHRLEQYPEAELDYPGHLYFNGRLLFEIIVTLTDASDFSFRGNIKANLGYYTNLIGDKTLRDLVYDGVVSIGETMADVVAHANLVVGQSYPAVGYNFPEHYNPKFYGEDRKMNLSWNPQFLVNAYIHGTGFHVNTIDMGYVVNNYYNLCPWPYLFKVLSHCFSEFGYRITGPVLADQELATALIYNNYALDLIEDRYKSRVALSDDQEIADLETIMFDEVQINIDEVWFSPTSTYHVLAGGTVHIEAEFLFEIFDTLELTAEYDILFMLDDVELANFSGNVTSNEISEYKVSFDANLTDDDIGKEIMVRARILYEAMPHPGAVKAGSWFSCQNVAYSRLNTFAKTINLANHVPDIKISAFLVALTRMFGIVYLFDHSTRDVELLFLKDILASTDEDVYTDLTVKSTRLAGFKSDRSYKLKFSWNSKDEYTENNFKPYDLARSATYSTLEDLPALSIEGMFARVLNLNAVYRFEIDAWVWFADLHDPVEVGDAVTEIPLECTPLMMYADYANPASPYVCPKILQEGGSINLGMKEFGFHLMFYRGLQADNQGHTYPFASCTKYSPTGTVIGNYELILDGANGIYKKFLEAYYNFVINKSRPVDYDRYFSASDIRELNFIRKKRIFQHLFLLDEVSIPISNDSIGVASMKLQKI